MVLFSFYCLSLCCSLCLKTEARSKYKRQNSNAICESPTFQETKKFVRKLVSPAKTKLRVPYVAKLGKLLDPVYKPTVLDVSGAYQGLHDWRTKKMADNYSEDPSSAKKLKKSNLRGPYNQYLSQPGLKIPRTTLRRWPQNFPTSTALPSDELSTESIGNDARPSGSFSIVTNDFTHMETDEPSHSLISQTADPFKTDDCESYCSQYEDYDHEHGDQYDPIQNVDGPLEPSDSGLAEILAEDEQDGIEDYLTAFDSEQSAGNEKTDDQGRESADGPLYSGAPITVAVSMLLIITFAIRHSLTGLALVDLSQPSLCIAKSMRIFNGFGEEIFYEIKEPHPVSPLLLFLHGVSRIVFSR